MAKLQGEVTYSPLHEQSGSSRPNVLWWQGLAAQRHESDGCQALWKGFLTKRLPKVATEMALNVLAYNIKRVMAIIGVAGLLEALAA